MVRWDGLRIIMKSLPRITVSASIGGALEMYDFVIYVFLAPIIAALFFPQDDTRTAMLMTFGIFAVGYFARPVGGILFGHLTDRVGRKQGLIWTVLTMAVPIFLIGCLPSYQDIGITAPILLLVLRILQGLSVGGEFPSASVFLAEHAPAAKRGFISSWLYCGINLGLLLGSVVAAILAVSMSTEQQLSFGWRLPFLLGGALAVVGYYIRRHLDETPHFVALKRQGKLNTLPVISLLRDSGWRCLNSIGTVCLMAVVIGTVFLYMPHYLHVRIGLSMSEALWLNSLSVLVFACLIPVFGKLVDHMGAKRTMLMGAWLFLLFSWPLYMVVSSGLTDGRLYWGLFFLSALGAMVVAPVVAMLTEIFPTACRTSGVALSYNVSFGVFNGIAPLALVWLGSYIVSAPYPAVYLMLGAVVTIVTLIFQPDTQGVDLKKVK